MVRSSLALFDCASGDDHWVLRVVGVELGRVQLVLAQAVKKANCSQHTTVSGHTDSRIIKPLLEQAAQRGGRQRPIPGRSPFSSVDGADTWDSDQQHAPGLSIRCNVAIALCRSKSK